ncbi:ABC transporter ATP-binding protein [Streptomyces sp. WM6372]|uniref:ABC transporter ATP-binding protein n=1 Tax=Streptomyces sp. WM6372 TaxID=1415555 RepID=UPI0006AFA443|nr:ABC transporter ATP-binding protein [Streptomyces sp. WM6372]
MPEDGTGAATPTAGPGERTPAARGPVRAALAPVRLRLAVLGVLLTARISVGVALPALLATAVGAVLDRTDVRGPAALLAAVLVAGALCEAAAGPLASSANATGTHRLRMLTVRHLLALGPRSPHAVGDAVTQVVRSAPMAAGLPAWAAESAISLLGSVAALAALWWTNWQAGLTFTLAMPLTVLIAQRFMKEAGRAQENYLGAQSRIADGLVAALAGVRTIRAAGTLAAETDRVLEPLPELSAAGRAMWRTERDVVWRLGLLLPLTDVLVLAVAGLAVADGRLSPAGLLAVSGYLALASGMVDQIDVLLGIAQARAGARRLGEVFRHEPPAGGTGNTVPADGAVLLRGVTVRHAGEPVLDRLDLDLPAGAAVALVGRTGAGKSVLAGLPGRLTDPDEGEISIGGVPVRELPLDRLRTLVVHAFERPELYGRTVHEAISFGRPGADREDVVRAARAARADRFVRRLPAGYDTPLDEAPMSGGERQRLGLARALLRPALVHVLDDATSGLDTVTEAEVSRSVTELLAGRTRLVVAHRAATAARCDLVAWLDSGRIRAYGPHHVLWADPEYRAVFGPAGAIGSLAGPDPTKKKDEKEEERCRVEHR